MSDPNEMIWADNERLPGQRIYIQRSALATLGGAGWVEGEPEPGPEPVPTPGDLVEDEAPWDEDTPEAEPVAADTDIPEPDVTPDESPSDEEASE